MPIKWTPELDAIILHGVFEECNISFSKALCVKLAERVTATGQDCSYKAIENRLYSWKKKNMSTSAPTGTGNGNVKSATNTPTATPKKRNPPKTPTSRAKATPKKKIHQDSVEPDGFVDDNDNHADGVEKFESPSAARGKRSVTREKQPRYAEDESEDDEGGPSKKKIKTEPTDPDLDLDYESAFGGGADGDDEV